MNAMDYGEDLLGIGNLPICASSGRVPLPVADDEQRDEQYPKTKCTTNDNINNRPTIVKLPPKLVDNIATSRSSQFIDSITSFIPPSLTAKCTLPDKTVASQVLMYRQLLHTACKPGLRLSRPFESTKAQRSVMYMPWWEKNVEQTKRMVISYDNLITRVWVYGAILPFVMDTQHDTIDNIDTTTTTHSHYNTSFKNINISSVEQAKEEGSSQDTTITVNQACINRGIDTMMNKETGLPPKPHDFWVTRAGFQQEDPVTDFRSGGVLSLAMLLHIVESCPMVHARFIHPNGDASVLPFGITSINVTDMLAKICMFSKAVNKMDALLSSKPFWRMFTDPNSLLVLQELSMDMLADVVVELGSLKKYHTLDDNEHFNLPSKMKDIPKGVTVFDFPDLMETLEKRVRDDLLASGPRDIRELRQIAHRLGLRYHKECEKKERAAIKRMQERHLQRESTVLGENTVVSVASASALNAVHFVAGNAEGLFNRFKGSIIHSSNSSRTSSTATTNHHQATCYQFARPSIASVEDDGIYFESCPSVIQENIITSTASSSQHAEKDLISL